MIHENKKIITYFRLDYIGNSKFIFVPAFIKLAADKTVKKNNTAERKDIVEVLWIFKINVAVLT